MIMIYFRSGDGEFGFDEFVAGAGVERPNDVGYVDLRRPEEDAGADDARHPDGSASSDRRRSYRNRHGYRRRHRRSLAVTAAESDAHLSFCAPITRHPTRIFFFGCDHCGYSNRRVEYCNDRSVGYSTAFYADHRVSGTAVGGGECDRDACRPFGPS